METFSDDGILKRLTNLYEPRFELVVDDNVVAVTFEAVSIGSHDWCHRLQRMHDAPGDVCEEFLCDCFSTRAF